MLPAVHAPATAQSKGSVAATAQSKGGVAATAQSKGSVAATAQSKGSVAATAQSKGSVAATAQSKGSVAGHNSACTPRVLTPSRMYLCLWHVWFPCNTIVSASVRV